MPAAVIAAELRVSERSVRRWRQAWLAGGPAGLASRGQAARCRLDDRQLAALDVALEAGPLAAGWTDQRWTLARVRDLVASKFRVQYTIPGIWYLLRRRGWTCQLGARRAIERDDGAVRGVEEGDLAADKSTAAALGGWIVFEDECGQSMRPPRSRTWGRRGITPVIRVRGGGTGRLGRRAGLLPARPPEPADLPAALLPRPQGRDEGVHLDRVPGSADRRAPATARRERRAGVGQPQVRHEALSFTDGGERPSISSPSWRWGEAGGSLIRGSPGRAGAASTKSRRFSTAGWAGRGERDGKVYARNVRHEALFGPNGGGRPRSPCRRSGGVKQEAA